MAEKLYDLLMVEKEAEAMAAENEGELTEEMLEKLVKAQLGANKKIEGLCKWMRNLDATARACKDEEQRLSKRRKSCENTVTSLKKFLLPFVMERGKVEAGTFKLSTGTSTRVAVNEEFFKEPDFGLVSIQVTVPVGINTKASTLLQKLARFYQLDPVYIPDKNMIKKALNAGQVVPGAEIQKPKYLLIK